MKELCIDVSGRPGPPRTSGRLPGLDACGEIRWSSCDTEVRFSCSVFPVSHRRGLALYLPAGLLQAVGGPGAPVSAFEP